MFLSPSIPHATSLQFVVKEEDGGRRDVAGVDWQFNAWGGHTGGLYSSWERDQQVAGTILQAGYGHPLIGLLGIYQPRTVVLSLRLNLAADGGLAAVSLPNRDGGRLNPRGWGGHAADNW
jgi:hypothetical protein